MHWWGKPEVCQPYLRHRALRKALLCNAKPCSAIGRACRQPARTSLLSRQAHYSLHLAWEIVLQFHIATYDWWCFLAFAVTFDSELFSLCSVGYWWDCSMMRVVNGAVIFCDASWCATALADGLGILRPPSCTGNAMSSWVLSLKVFWPVGEARNFCQIISSNGKSRLLANVGDGSGKVGPFARKSMRKCSLRSVRLRVCNGG